MLARRWEPAQQSYQGIDFASLSEEQSLHLDIVMLRAIMRDLPTLAKGGPYFLSINLNPTLNSPTYQNLLLLVLMQARKLGIEVWFEVLEQAPLLRQHRALIEVLRSHGAHIACDDFGTLGATSSACWRCPTRSSSWIAPCCCKPARHPMPCAC